MVGSQKMLLVGFTEKREKILFGIQLFNMGRECRRILAIFLPVSIDLIKKNSSSI